MGVFSSIYEGKPMEEWDGYDSMKSISIISDLNRLQMGIVWINGNQLSTLWSFAIEHGHLY